jgi:hypothetical protein
MAFLEYRLNDYRNSMLVCENDSENRWIFKRSKKNKAQTSLEEEIHSLRCQLEQMVIEGRTMTSEAVVELSTLLDLKINEYMNKARKSRR